MDIFKTLIFQCRTSPSISLHGGFTGRQPEASPATGSTSQCGINSFEAGSSSGGKEMSRLVLNPIKNHKPEKYEDMELDVSSLLLSSLEMHLPSYLLGASRKNKASYMRGILQDYVPPALRYRVCFHFSISLPYYVLIFEKLFFLFAWINGRKKWKWLCFLMLKMYFLYIKQKF